MTAGIRVAFTVVADELKPTLTKINKEYRVSRKAINEIEGSYKKLESAALGAIRRQETSQSKLNRTTEGLKLLVEKNKLTQEEMNVILKKEQERVEGTAAARKVSEANAKRLFALLNPIAARQKEIYIQAQAYGLSLAKTRVLLRQTREEMDGTAAANKKATADAAKFAATLDPIRTKQKELFVQAKAYGATISQIRKVMRELRAEMDGTAAASERQKAAFSRIKAQLDPIRTRQKEIYEYAKAQGFSLTRVRAMMREIREEADGTAAARRKDAAQVEKLKASLDPLKAKEEAINREVKRGNLDRKDAVRIMDKLRASQKRVVTVAGKIKDEVKSMAVSYLSIAAAAETVRRSVVASLEAEQERGRLIKNSVDSKLTFAVLNRGNNVEEEIAEVQQLGVRYGFGRNKEERDQLFDAGQSLQAAYAQFGEVDTRAALETYLQAQRVGIRQDVVKELLVQGTVQTPEDPQYLLRAQFAGGEQSGRDPTLLGQAGAVFSLFDDVDFAAGVSVAIGNVTGAEIKTFVQSAAQAINSDIDRKKLGLDGESSEVEVLKAARDFVKPEGKSQFDIGTKLEELGVNNIRRDRSMIILMQEFDKVVNEYIPNIRRAASNPNIFAEARAALDAKSPTFAVDTRQRQTEARQFNNEVNDVTSQLRFLRDTRIGEALRTVGARTFFGRPTVGEDGAATLAGRLRAEYGNLLGGAQLDFNGRPINDFQLIRETNAAKAEYEKQMLKYTKDNNRLMQQQRVPVQNLEPLVPKEVAQ